MTVSQTLEQVLSHCDQKLRVHTVLPAKRERRLSCKIKNGRCLSCATETTRILDKNDFPLVVKTDRKQDLKKVKCAQVDDTQNPKLFIEKELQNYRAEFGVMPALLFSLGLENTLGVYHLKPAPLKSAPQKKLLVEQACPRLFARKFKIRGRLDLTGDYPKIRTEKSANLSYFVPTIPPEKIKRTMTSALLIEESSLDRNQVNDGDEVTLEGHFVAKTLNTFAPELPAILEKNTLIFFKPSLVIRKPQPAS